MDASLALLNYLIIIVVVMLIYISVLYEKKMSLGTKYFIIFFSIIPLTLVATFRAIGTDTISYRIIFDSLDYFKISEFMDLFQTQLEPGFLLIVSIIKYLSLNVNFLLFTFFIVPVLLAISLIFKIEHKNLLLMYLFFLLFNLLKGPMDIIRHFFAAIIYLSSLYSLSKSKLIASYFKIFIASMFHYSSLIGLPIIAFLLKIKWSFRKYSTALIITLLLGYLLKDTLINRVNDWNLGNINATTFLYKIQGYIDVDFVGSNILLNIVLQTSFHMPLILNIVVAYWFFKVLTPNNNKFILVLHKAQIIGTIISLFIMSIGATVAGYRMDFFLGIGSFILVPYIINHYAGKKKIIVFTFFLVYLLSYNLLLILYFLR